MSEENVENFKRTIEAFKRRDIEAVLPQRQAKPSGEFPLTVMVGTTRRSSAGRYDP